MLLHINTTHEFNTNLVGPSAEEHETMKPGALIFLWNSAAPYSINLKHRQN